MNPLQPRLETLQLAMAPFGRSGSVALLEIEDEATRDAAMIEAHSPVNLAARITAPVLLAYGENDLRVPLAHGQRMRDALAAAGHPPEWVSYPGEGHGFGLLKNRVDFALRMEAFLAKQLGPAAPDAH